MDTWQGRMGNPTTLNKYLYADARPTMYVDPTGQFSLGNLMAGLRVQNILSKIANTARVARRKKTMDLYNYTSWPLHVYMYAERKGAGTGTRYDVGNALGWGGVTKKNAFSVLRGGYVGAAYANKKSLEGKGVKTHSMTYIQYILWHATVVRSHQPTCEIPLDYSLNPFKGTNCVSWTAQVVLEKQNNQTVASYTYGDDLLSQTVATGTNFYGYDGLGSTKFLTDTNGQITDTYQYDAYGEITSKTGTTDNNYLYTGEQYDRSLNQYYLRARYYNQGVGRFTQMDTWQGKPNRPSSLNKYLYAEANPVMFTDPSGNTINISGLMAGVNGMRTMSMVRTVVAQGGGAAARVLGIGGSSSSAAGGMVIANRLGLNYFKTIYRNCRGRGRKNDVCNYAKGFVEAHLKMRAMVALTPNSARNRKKNRVFTVAGAFDYKHGKGVAAFNGEHRNTSKRLVQHARRMGLQIGGCYGSVTAGRCAEFRAADKLIRGRSKIKDIRWTWAYSVDKNKSTGFLKINGRKDYCHVCQTGLNVRN